MATQQANNSKQANAKQQGGKRPPPAAGGASKVGAGGAAERDENYGLISVLYHSLQGAETYSQYINDARRAGKNELVEFFRDCQEEENARAKRARELLADSLEEADEEDEDEDEDEQDEDEEEED